MKKVAKADSKALVAVKKRFVRRFLVPMISAGVVILALIGLLVWSGIRGAATDIDSKSFQAIFLSNGQVYFGKLQTFGSGSLKLTDIFYLQSSTGNDTTNPQAATSSTNSSNVSLIKLGSEVHGPEDEMVIQKSQVLFYENLKSDSKVAQTIQTYNNNHK